MTGLFERPVRHLAVDNLAKQARKDNPVRPRPVERLAGIDGPGVATRVDRPVPNPAPHERNLVRVLEQERDDGILAAI